MKQTLESIRQYINEGVYDPGIFKAFFLAGGPGSGKTFVTQSAFAGTGLKLVNSDVKFERDLRKANLSLKMPDEEAYFRDRIRQGAKDFVGKQIDTYVKGRLGLIIDATGRDYGVIQRQSSMLKLLGYDCYMVFVNTSLEVALKRNQLRARKLPDAIVINSHKQIQQNIGKLQRIFGSNNFIIVDNNKVAEDVNPKVHKSIRRMVGRKPTSYQAVSWIKRELQKRKR